MNIVAFNDLDKMVCDIQNTYIIALCTEEIWTFAGPEFGEEEGTLMVVKMELYGLKS